MSNQPEPASIDAMPSFIEAHAEKLPDPDAARGILLAYRDTLDEWREHPSHDGPRQDEIATLDGPPTFQRISGRLDSLFLAMQWLALPLSDLPDYLATWRPAVLDD